MLGKSQVADSRLRYLSQAVLTAAAVPVTLVVEPAKLRQRPPVPTTTATTTTRTTTATGSTTATSTTSATQTTTPPPTFGEDAALEAEVFKSHRPTFIHIPKTAGESIKTAVDRQKLNVAVLGEGACKWHTPPETFVRGSFVVVRRVLDRLVSEFCWVRMRAVFSVYKKEYGVPEVWPYTCDMFNAWLAAALLAVKRWPLFPDCHMVPQWCYASKAEYLLPHSETMLQASLRSLHPLLANIDLKQVNTDGAIGPCKRFNITPACINHTNMVALRAHFADDFDNLEVLFTGSARESRWVAPFMRRTGPWQLGPVSHQNADCADRTATKTLLPPTLCRRPEVAPADARLLLGMTCVGSLLECARLAVKDAECSSVIIHSKNATSPGSSFPGWCKCVLRGRTCKFESHAGTNVASFAKINSFSPRCPAL